ncbi:MAG: response regulator transcription factor [Planctomycetota bacterium]|jgi:two-component system OmpR family response regulator
MRILVVEDEPELLSAVAQSLREEGYAVDEAADGVSGLFKAQSWEYDAIILDLMLPGLNGWELLKRLRKTRRIPVLILSARDTVEDRVDGLDLGADDYLVKPFELAELHARLRSLIRRAANQPTARISVAGAEVDLKARTLKFAGRPVELTAREFAIVELLALRRGEVVTRTQIYDHIFDENDDSLSNLLDVHISNIRKKIDKDFITTRRGQGYLLEG